MYVDRLGGLVAGAAETGRGRVVFLAGGPGSGRSFWSDAVARTLSGARVVAGGFVEGRYVPRPDVHHQALSADAESLINSIAGSGTLLGPIGALIGQLITVSLAAYRVAEGLRRTGESVGFHELLPGLLRTAAAEDSARPLVCLIDDADEAEGNWWANLLLSFAQEVELELRLVLVMGIDGPVELGDAPREGETGACAVARSLLGRGLGEWWALHGLSRREVASWVGPASPELLSAVWTITEGEAGEIPGLWESWERRNLIRQDEDGRWRIVGDLERTLAEAGDRFNAQLTKLLGHEKLHLISNVREILACAALEGSTFTPDAVARALSWDRDDLIDLLDDHLTGESGALREATPAEIPQIGGETRTVWRYSFIRSLDRRIARVRFASPAERRSLAQRLAPALIATYAPEQGRVAATLAALFVRAGDAKAAEPFRRIANLGVERTTLRAQARYLLSTSTELWNAWDLRRSAELLIHATNILADIDRILDTLQVAERAAELARRAGAQFLHVEAVLLQGYLHVDLGEPEQARRDVRQAKEMLGGAPSPLGEGNVWSLLGWIELSVSNYDAARAATQRALRLSQQIGDRHGEAGLWQQLGSIELRVDNLEAARASNQRTLKISQQEAYRDRESQSLYQLGWIELGAGNLEAARASNQRTLNIGQEMADRRGEAACLYQLGEIEIRLGNLEAARASNQRALKINQEMGTRQGEAASLRQLGEIEIRLGNLEAARAPIQHALQINQQIGSRHGEARCFRDLGRLELAERRVEAARAPTESSLKIVQEIGDRDGEAAGFRQLGQIELAVGNVEAARRLAERSLNICEEIGNRAGEADSKRLLDELN